jgi:hypothetical protein
VTRASLKWRAYGLLRPLIRPVMHRIRTFFVGNLHAEIAELRREIHRLSVLIEQEQPEALKVIVDQRTRQIMAQALVTLALDRESRDQASDDLPFST